MKLLAHTPNPEELVTAAARQTKSARAVDAILSEALERPRALLIAKQ